MSATNARYLSTLHDNMDRYFNLEEIRTLCFDLGVDFDSVRGEGKAPRIRELILSLGRKGRLAELLEYLKDERPHVNWPPVPDDLELPQSLPSEAAAANVTYNYYGDVVHGDKTGGDKIEIGTVQNSTLAVGSQASATTTSGDTFNMSGNFQGANVNVKSTLENVAQTVGALPAGDAATKEALQRLLAELNNVLQTAPADHATQAEELSQSTSILVAEGTKEQPNQTMINMLGSGLRSLAEKLGAVLPPVVSIIDQIVTAVHSLSSR